MEYLVEMPVCAHCLLSTVNGSMVIRGRHRRDFVPRPLPRVSTGHMGATLYLYHGAYRMHKSGLQSARDFTGTTTGSTWYRQHTIVLYLKLYASLELGPNPNY